MKPVTSAEARAYLDRWRQVAEAQLELLRTESVEVRLRQLSVLMASRQLFDDDAMRAVRAAQVRERWLRIRAASHG